MSITWKQIPNWEGVYEASSDGEIRSMTRQILSGPYMAQSTRYGKRLRQHYSKDGYKLVSLTRPSEKSKTTQVHRLVCAAFHGPAPDGAECCHANDVRDDNRAKNLSWGTRQSNAVEMASRHRIKGAKHPRAKLTAFQVFMLREMPGYRGIYRDITASFGISRSVLNNIRSGNNWAWL